MSCPSLKLWMSSAASTPATGSPPTSSAMSARSARICSKMTPRFSGYSARRRGRPLRRRSHLRPCFCAAQDGSRDVHRQLPRQGGRRRSARSSPSPARTSTSPSISTSSAPLKRPWKAKTGPSSRMDPHTGEILAMVSRPTFDPNEFAVRLSRGYWQIHPHRPRPPSAEQGHPGAARSGLHLQDHHVRRGPRKKASPRTLRVGCSGRGQLLRPLLRLRRPPRHRHHRQRHPLQLRHLLLHPGRAPGHRPHRRLGPPPWAWASAPGLTCPTKPQGVVPSAPSGRSRSSTTASGTPAKPSPSASARARSPSPPSRWPALSAASPPAAFSTGPTWFLTDS